MRGHTHIGMSGGGTRAGRRSGNDHTVCSVAIEELHKFTQPSSPTAGFLAFCYGVNGVLLKIPAWTTPGQTARELPQLLLKVMQSAGVASRALPLGPAL